MRKSILSQVQGHEIKAPSWNLDIFSDILTYAGENFIYVARISPEQYAIVHWADIETAEELTHLVAEDKSVKEFIDQFYSRKLVIPMSIAEINELRNGKLTLRETYVKHPIFVIEGLNDCRDEIRVWEKCDMTWLDGYLPVPNHSLNDQ